MISGIERHYLMTRIVAQDGVKLVQIRTGFTWHTYEPEEDLGAEYPDEVDASTMRMVELVENVPYFVLLDGIWHGINQTD